MGGLNKLESKAGNYKYISGKTMDVIIYPLSQLNLVSKEASCQPSD